MSVIIGGNKISNMIAKVNSTENEAKVTTETVANYMDQMAGVSAGVTFRHEVAANLLPNMKDIERHF